MLHMSEMCWPRYHSRVVYLELLWGFPQSEMAEAVLPDGSVPVAGGEVKGDGVFSAENPNKTALQHDVPKGPAVPPWLISTLQWGPQVP